MPLGAGCRVGVVGGGPAGSGFALFARHYARQRGIDLRITVFEARDFHRPGPWGCNMCAGLIPIRDLEELELIGIRIPERIIRARIHRYTLHTAAGVVTVSQPDPASQVCSVYRGHGPRRGPPWPDQISLDGFLLAAARRQGVELVRERVTSIDLRSGPTIRTRRQELPVDVVVLASGVNRLAVSMRGLEYRPPRREQMAQTEFCPGSEAVRAALGNSVHVFLPSDDSFSFATLVPKGPCLNVSLLGRHLPPGVLERFLTRPEVAALVPQADNRSCGCRPHIAVSAARPLYADRFVAVGDAGITRLYKNGIGAALRTARQAAHTAVNYGVDRSAFRQHYAPLCRQIALDNQAGRILFAVTGLLQRSPRLMEVSLRSLAAEQSLPPAERFHSRLLWGMFTGVQPYRALLAMAVRPSLHLQLWRQLFG